MHRIDITEYMPATRAELERKTGMSYRTVLRHLQRTPHHISGWRPPVKEGQHAPIYSAGPGVNVPMPIALTSTESVRKFYARKKQRSFAWMAALIK